MASWIINLFEKTSDTTKDTFLIPWSAIANAPNIDGLMPKSGGTFTGEVKFGSTENFQGYYIKRMIGSLGIGARYADLDSSYKDGTWHRMWRLRFPSGSNFWGKIKITLYGGYSSFNASGVMSKSITCNFNAGSIYNNVGCYDGLGVNVEQDFRISEAIWNATASAWEVLIWQKNLNGNNSPTIMLECWTTNNTNYINAFKGIAAQTVELTQSTSYSAQKASSTGGTKTVTWETLPVYENPLGEEIATVDQIPDVSGKANLNGGNTLEGAQVITGFLDIRGTAAEKHLKTCGIGGSDGNGNSNDLYLQYSSNYKTYFGNTAQSSLNADGSISITSGTTTGNLTVGGNLTINGTTTTVDSTTLQVKDKLIEVAHGNTTTLTTPAGLVAPKYDGTNSGALVFDSTGTAYVGDVTLKDGNIDVANSGLQPLATRTGLVGGNLVQYDSSELTLKDSGKKISDLATLTGGNTFTGKQTLTSPPADGYSIDASGYIKGSWLQAPSTGHSESGTGRVCVMSDNGWIYYRTPAEIVSDGGSGKANLDGGNTFSGVQTINAPTDVNGSETTTLKAKTSNGGAIIFGKEGPNDGTMIRLDQTDGTCRLRFRSSKTAGAIVWEQPEQGAKLHVDLGKDGSDKHRVTFPSSGGTLALTSQVNAKYTKPADGIPKTDLESAVQTSLGKADNALSLDGGTIKKSKTIKMDASANSDGANLKWGTVNSKNPYIGYASDQSDGTFVVGSLLGTNYASGLAIGGGSGNLLWKGTKVATTSDIPTNYVTTDTEQSITAKKTVITPDNTDDSTQIANTSWVRENYQATCYAGRDSGETDTRYFKVASYSTVADYDHVTLVAHLQDIDSPVFSTVNVHCSTSTKAYAPSAFIGVVDNFTHNASNNPFNYYKDRLFVVANYTIGTQGVTFELWLKTTDKYQQTIFKVISQSSRKGTSKKRPWTLYNNVTTASGTTDFSETSSDGRLVVNNNYLYGATVNYLQPQTNNNIDLGASGKRWNNGYITNLQNCKIINGGGGNSMIQQDSDTSGADITVGSTGCPLKIQGKNARPTYRQGKNGTYANLALQSDIPTFSLSGTTLTITL